MKKFTKKDLNKFLKTATKSELEKEIKKLYDKFPVVEEFYAMKLSPATETVLKKYKNRLHKIYFPARGFAKPPNSKSRKVINDFKKIATSRSNIIELILYRVEMMLLFSDERGDLGEAYYNSLTRSFDEACRMIAKERLTEDFRTYGEELVQMSNSVGWGVTEALRYSWEQL